METYSVNIISKTIDEARALQAMDLDLKYRAARRTAPARFVTPGILNSDQLDALLAAGYEVDVVADMTQVAKQRRLEISKVNRFADAQSVRDFGTRNVMGYMTTAEIDSAITNLQTAHPSLVSIITLPHTTWQGRTCRAIRIRGGAAGPRTGVLVSGGVHAREWGGSDICVAFATNMVNAYVANTALTYGGKTFTASQVKHIVEHLEVYVFPNVNPDGKEYSQTHDPGAIADENLWWRKNRNPNLATGGANLGVDVNRNFDFLWSSGIGTSTSPASLIYRGTGPFSEPESQNLMALLDSNPTIRYFVDIHSFSGLILYAWGDDDDQSIHPDQVFGNAAFASSRGKVAGEPGAATYGEFITPLDRNTVVGLANRMSTALTAVRGTTYTVEQSVGLYPTSATSDDYAFSRHITDTAKAKVYSYTIEFGNEFVPPIAEMQNIIGDISSALTELCAGVAADVFIRDNAADTGDTPSSGTFWDSPDIWVRNAADGGTAHQDTIRGATNYIYVRVHNRGIEEARNIFVRMSITNFAGTEFRYPEDWIPLNPAGGGSISAVGTYFIGEQQIASIAAGASAVVHVPWNASLIPPAAGWHPCLLVECAPCSTAPMPGPHVWESNNLAQKNITIVTAKATERVLFQFRLGSRFAAASAASEVSVERLSGPRAAVYLDLEDDHLLSTIKPVRVPGARADELEPIADETVDVTLLEDAHVELDGSGVTRNAEVLQMRLPANTKLTIARPPALTPVVRPVTPIAATAANLDLVTIGGKKLLALGDAAAIGRLRIPLEKSKTMSLSVVVPPNAARGDQYLYQVVQYGADKRPVGGVVLQINVV